MVSLLCSDVEWTPFFCRFVFASYSVIFRSFSASIDMLALFTMDVISGAVIDKCDKPPGHDTLLKITGNTITISMVETLAEAHLFAEKPGARHRLAAPGDRENTARAHPVLEPHAPRRLHARRPVLCRQPGAQGRKPRHQARGRCGRQSEVGERAQVR